ncbi:TadE family protein [Desulfofundulus thermobenzoicus]|uniref:TadE/TadG family type IV pilus assembly protein n=1 Tax=Desulfofundulus thermobenzoicus TaxID=29376 RepID=UPI00311AB7F5
MVSITRFLKSEQGYILEFVLFMGFLFYCVFGILVYGMYTNSQSVCISAAREAARTLAVTHDMNQSKSRAAEVIQTTLYTGARIGGSRPGEPRKAFDPYSPNPSHPDVVLQDDGTYCRAWVYYHMPNAVPGLPKLLDKRASFLSRYITTGGYAVFKREVQ